MTGDTHICCRAVDSVAVTTCFYDLDLSWVGFEQQTFRMRGEYKRLRHSNGSLKGVSVLGDDHYKRIPCVIVRVAR